jgi:hypothetical protein
MDLRDAMTEALDGGADPQVLGCFNTDSDMMRDHTDADLPASA